MSKPDFIYYEPIDPDPVKHTRAHLVTANGRVVAELERPLCRGCHHEWPCPYAETEAT